MADIAPLLPLRYAPELLPRVVAPPYDVIDAKMRAELGARHPHNVVHIDLPEGEGQAKYDTARALFARWQAEGVLVRDTRPAFWRYEQTFDPPGGGARITRKGFFALVRAVPFVDRVVLPHERTLTGPKIDRLELSRATRAVLSPQFMLYADPRRELDAHLDGGEPFAEFATDDGIEHRITRVTGATDVVSIANRLANGKLYIADGHHRYETAVKLSQELDAEARAQGPVSDRGEHLFTVALLANGDDPDLVVFPTHRLVHSLTGFDFSKLVEQAGELYTVHPVEGDAAALGQATAKAGGRAVCAVGPDGQAALMVPRDDVDLAAHPVLGKRPEVVRATAVALLHDGLLQHVLGITPEAQAAKTNLRYLQDAREGIEAVQGGGAQVLFLMNATPVSTIRRVADAGEVMPQKSTFFHPKVPSGLLFHTLDASRQVP